MAKKFPTYAYVDVTDKTVSVVNGRGLTLFESSLLGTDLERAARRILRHRYTVRKSVFDYPRGFYMEVV